MGQGNERWNKLHVSSLTTRHYTTTQRGHSHASASMIALVDIAMRHHAKACRADAMRCVDKDNVKGHFPHFPNHSSTIFILNLSDTISIHTQIPRKPKTETGSKRNMFQEVL